MTMIMDDRYGRLPDPDDRTEAGYYRGVNTRRLLAWVVDAFLILIIGSFLIPFTVFTAFLFLPVFFLIVGFVYRVLTLTTGSATLGMRIMGIEMRHIDGTKLEFKTAFWHTLLYSIAIAVSPLQLISVIMMLVTDHKQGLHDMILGTAPIRTKA